MHVTIMPAHGTPVRVEGGTASYFSFIYQPIFQDINITIVNLATSDTDTILSGI